MKDAGDLVSCHNCLQKDRAAATPAERETREKNRFKKIGILTRKLEKEQEIQREGMIKRERKKRVTERELH